MTSEYSFKSFGTTLTLQYNNSRDGAAGKSVYIGLDSFTGGACTSVKGEKAIREFLYNFAVIGGIIKEGETLSIAEPSDKEVPADGIYRLDGAADSRKVAVVQGGRVLVPQPSDGEILDYTDVYLSKYSGWVLTRLEQAERVTRNYA